MRMGIQRRRRGAARAVLRAGAECATAQSGRTIRVGDTTRSARGTSVGVGAKIGSSRVVDSHQRRDKVGFGLVFLRGSDGKPMICGHAARFARVEGEVRKIQKPKIFGGRIFWRGNTNAEYKC